MNAGHSSDKSFPLDIKVIYSFKSLDWFFNIKTLFEFVFKV